MALPIIAMEPMRQRALAVLRGFEGLGIGPFAQCGLDEALSLAVGLRREGLGEKVFEADLFAGLADFL